MRRDDTRRRTGRTGNRSGRTDNRIEKRRSSGRSASASTKDRQQRGEPQNGRRRYKRTGSQQRSSERPEATRRPQNGSRSGNAATRTRSGSRQQSSRPRNGGRRRYTEEELRYLRRKQQARRKKRRKQLQQRRMAALLVLVFFCYLGFRLVSGTLNFIENSRAAQRGEIETVQETSGLDVAAAAEAGESVLESQADTTTDISDPTHVLSNGRYLDLTKPMVALTFDDGPKSDVGNALMDELEAVDGRGTFFVVGERLEEHQAELQRMVDNGHEIANHSWDHDLSLTNKGVDYIRSEFSKTDDKLRELVGIETTLVRLPGGKITDDVKSAITKPMIYWSLDTEDWKSRNAQSVEAKVDGNVKDGDIILMHELYSSTEEACREIIPRLHDEGFQLVTVSELIQFRNAEVAGSNGIQYQSFPPTETSAAKTEAESTEAESSAADDSASESGTADGTETAGSEGAA